MAYVDPKQFNDPREQATIALANVAQRFLEDGSCWCSLCGAFFRTSR
jgi:hypothetical protein